MSKIEAISHPVAGRAKTVAVTEYGPAAFPIRKHAVENRLCGLHITLLGDSVGAGPGIAPGPVSEKSPEARAETLLLDAAEADIAISCIDRATVTDIAPADSGVEVSFRRDDGIERMEFGSVVMADGHRLSRCDAFGLRMAASPAAISDRPNPDCRNIGLIGTSTSALEACLALAEKNGVFVRDFDGRLRFLPNFGLQDFRMVMHAPGGVIPPVRIDGEHPRFEMSSYAHLAAVNAHIEENGGHMSLGFLFERVLQTVLKETSPEVFGVIAKMDLETFSEFLEKRGGARDPLDLPRVDYLLPLTPIRDRSPIYWREVLADIAYTLDFHLRHLGAGDVARVHNQLMPLLAYLVDLLPQSSCEHILALHEADCLSVVSVGSDLTISEGKGDERPNLSFRHPQTGHGTTLFYDVILNCRDQNSGDLHDLPFRALLDAGIVTKSTIHPEPKAPRGGTRHATEGLRIGESFRAASGSRMPMRSGCILAAPAAPDIDSRQSDPASYGAMKKMAVSAFQREAAFDWRGRPLALPKAGCFA